MDMKKLFFLVFLLSGCVEISDPTVIHRPFDINADQNLTVGSLDVNGYIDVRGLGFIGQPFAKFYIGATQIPADSYWSYGDAITGTFAGAVMPFDGNLTNVSTVFTVNNHLIDDSYSVRGTINGIECPVAALAKEFNFAGTTTVKYGYSITMGTCPFHAGDIIGMKTSYDFSALSNAKINNGVGVLAVHFDSPD